MAILQRLRAFTEESHRNIEVELSFLLSPAVTLNDIKGLLSGFYTFIIAQEIQMIGLTDDKWLKDIDLHGRLKQPALYFDLRNLGMTDDEITNLPRCGNLPPLQTTAQRLGYLYVIEGSSLGGRIINLHLASTLGLSGSKKLRYFSPYGDAHVGSYWRQYTQVLCQFLQEHPEQETLLFQAAQDTFKKLSLWLRRFQKPLPALESPIEQGKDASL